MYHISKFGVTLEYQPSAFFVVVLKTYNIKKKYYEKEKYENMYPQKKKRKRKRKNEWLPNE